jgi:hypothetical protein
MAVLDDCKTLLGISGSDQDAILQLYIRRAGQAVRFYLNTDCNPETDYPDAVLLVVMEALERRGNEGLSQFMQGSRQGSYEPGLSEEVRSLLPAPCVGLHGGA